MKENEKEEILNQVSSVLKLCHEIVFKLSIPSMTITSNDGNCEEDKSRYPDNFASSNISDTVAAKYEDDEEDDYNNNYWWDSHYPPSHFYCLVYDDDDVSLYDVDTGYDGYDLQLTDEACLEVPDAAKTKVSTPSSIASRSSSDSSSGGRVTTTTSSSGGGDNNNLQSRLLSFFTISTKDSIYNVNWKENLKRKAVHPVFFSVWCHYKAIFSDDTGNDDDVKTPPAEVEDVQYPTIDLHNVNARFIGNIPKPSYFPIHGVSLDPDMYHKEYPRNDYYHVQKYFKFNEPHPFGSAYGYETDAGIVAPPSDPIHGYVWCGGGWVLHAVKPGDVPASKPRRRRG